MEGPLQLKRQPHGQRTSCCYKPSVHPWKLFGCDVRLNGAADRLPFVAAQIVPEDDIAGPEDRDEYLLDIGQEAAAVDRAIDYARRLDAVPAQSCQEGERVPAPVRGPWPPADRRIGSGRDCGSCWSWPRSRR